MHLQLQKGSNFKTSTSPLLTHDASWLVCIYLICTRCVCTFGIYTQSWNMIKTFIEMVWKVINDQSKWSWNVVEIVETIQHNQMGMVQINENTFDLQVWVTCQVLREIQLKKSWKKEMLVLKQSNIVYNASIVKYVLFIRLFNSYW
jgi:hypothetical protein